MNTNHENVAVDHAHARSRSSRIRSCSRSPTLHRRYSSFCADHSIDIDCELIHIYVERQWLGFTVPRS